MTQQHEMVHLVVQEGGSSTEIYFAQFATADEAQAHRDSCAEAAYRTSPVIPVPRSLAEHPEFGNTIHEILRGTWMLGYPTDPEF